MSGILDQQSIPVECENCGAKTPKTIGWLKTHKQLTCACGTEIEIDASQFLGEIKKAERSFDDLKRRLGKLGK